MLRTAAFVFVALVVGQSCMPSDGFPTTTPSGKPMPPMRINTQGHPTLEDGLRCVGLSNGVRTVHSRFCKSMKCEEYACVSRCTLPVTGDPINACQISL